MTEGSNRGNPLYSPAGDPVGFNEWADSRDERAGRLSRIVFPLANRGMDRLEPKAKEFLVTALRELEYLSGSVFTDQGYYPSEIPIFTIVSEGPEYDYNLNGVKGFHDEETLIGAQTFVDALCPEQGIDVQADWQSLVDQAIAGQRLGFSDALGPIEAPDFLNFPTVLQGVVLTCDRFYENTKPDIGLQWNLM